MGDEPLAGQAAARDARSRPSLSAWSVVVPVWVTGTEVWASSFTDLRVDERVECGLLFEVVSTDDVEATPAESPRVTASSTAGLLHVAATLERWSDGRERLDTASALGVSLFRLGAGPGNDESPMERTAFSGEVALRPAPEGHWSGGASFHAVPEVIRNHRESVPERALWRITDIVRFTSDVPDDRLFWFEDIDRGESIRELSISSVEPEDVCLVLVTLEAFIVGHDD